MDNSHSCAGIRESFANIPDGRKEVGLYGKNCEIRIQRFSLEYQESAYGFQQAQATLYPGNYMSSMNLIYQKMRGKYINYWKFVHKMRNVPKRECAMYRISINSIQQYGGNRWLICDP